MEFAQKELAIAQKGAAHISRVALTLGLQSDQESAARDDLLVIV